MNAHVFWNAVTGDADLTGYLVYYGIDGVNWEGFQFVATPTLEYTFTGLHDWKTHYYAVSAVDAQAHESSKSQVVSKRNPHRFHLK